MRERANRSCDNLRPVIQEVTKAPVYSRRRMTSGNIHVKINVVQEDGHRVLSADFGDSRGSIRIR